MLFPIFNNYRKSGGGSSISLGRTASATAGGTGVSTYAVSWSTGGAPAAGTIIYAVIADNIAGTGTLISDSSGNTWYAAPGNYNSSGNGNLQVYYRTVAASGEPTSYTISLNAASKFACGTVCIIEVIGANATNPDDSQYVANSGTPHSVTSSAASDAILLFVADLTDSSNWTSPPTGYATQVSQDATQQTGVYCQIATKLLVGSGTISPGAFASPDTSLSQIFTVALKV